MSTNNSNNNHNDEPDQKSMTYAEVSKHHTRKDAYLVVHDQVYDVSSFVDEHPFVISPPLILPTYPPIYQNQDMI